MEYDKRAEMFFRQGYNCAQSVFLAFAVDIMDKDEAARLASAMGGGLAGMRMTCGAVSGMAMAYGLMRGYSDPEDKGAKQNTYEAVRDMAQEFERINGSMICRELLGLSPNTKYVAPSERTAEYYDKRPCPRLCACAAGILAKRLEQREQEAHVCISS